MEDMEIEPDGIPRDQWAQQSAPQSVVGRELHDPPADITTNGGRLPMPSRQRRHRNRAIQRLYLVEEALNR
eukprot:3214499-Heterocapsa_arctica.AAC.1